MAGIDGQFEYSSTGNILKRILNSNKNLDSLKPRSLYGNKLVDTQSPQFLDQAQDEPMQTVYSTVHHSAGPSVSNTNASQREGRYVSIAGGVNNHGYRERGGGKTFVCNDINGTDASYGSLDHSATSASPRAHSQFDQSDMDGASNSSSFQSEFLNISEGIDLDSLTPANLCRLSFVDLANLTIVSLVQLQKYGQIILNLQQEVSVLKDEIDNMKLKGARPQNSKKQSTNCARESISNAAENFQKLDAMLEKLPSGKVRDCVECLFSEDGNRKSSHACRVCWRGLHRSPACVYKHRCLKTLVRDLGLSNDAEDFDNEDSACNDYVGYYNGDLYNGLNAELATVSPMVMSTPENLPATPKSIPSKRKKSMPNSLPNSLPNKVIKKQSFGNGRVDAIFHHCINKMEAGSRRECSSCSNRKAGKRQRSRYMCAQCGRGLHSRGSCITVHPCWIEEFKGWVPGIKEFKKTIQIKNEPVSEDVTIREMDGTVVSDMDVTTREMDVKDETTVMEESRASEVNYEVVAVGGLGEDEEDIDQMIGGVDPSSQEKSETMSGVSANINNQSLIQNGQQGNDGGKDDGISEQELRRVVQKEFQAEVANVLKVLDEG